MNIEKHLPSKPLNAFIRTYLIIDCNDERVNQILPDTALVMAFRFKGRVSYLNNDIKNDLPVSAVSGLRRSGRGINYSANSGNILVIFKEAGAHMFFKEPIYEMFDATVPLNNFSGYENISCVEDQFGEVSSNAQKIQAVERYLLSKLNNNRSDLLVLAALEKIRATNGIIKIKELAAILCISQDAFEKRFRRSVGVSPKQFAYLVKMKSIVAGGLKNKSLIETAFNAGYFDQSHFNKDFKLFTGQTPTDFLKSSRLW